MTAPFKPTREMIDAVADWRQTAVLDRATRPLVPLLRSRFDLSAADAIEVIRAANAGEETHAEAS